MSNHKHYIGIDLGTSYSLISVFKESKPIVIPNSLGSYLTPSVVGIDDDGSILVGESAKERLITDPLKTASQFKRLMGTDKEISIANKSFRAEELSSFILRALKADAEAFLGETISEAIISVPAYFNDSQRKATRAAGELAGLNVERLINEPTAAAIAYGLANLDKEMTFIVLDLGGGTFDVTILELFDNTFEVLASSGDTFLGGNDFTTVIADHMKTIAGISDIDLTPGERNMFWKNAEQSKIDLSTRDSVSKNLLLKGCSVPWEMSRSEFNAFCEPLFDKMRTPVERVISDSGVRPSSLSAVVLVGGATRMPFVKELANRMFTRTPYDSIDPDRVVALGACIQSALKSRNEAFKDIVMTDVCPYTLGVDVVRQTDMDKFVPGQFLPVIERNTTIPVSRSTTLQTIRDNQTSIEVKIYQGESRLVENNILLGTLKINVPKGKAGEQHLDVRFTYDVNGLLEVEVFSHGTGLSERLVIEENPGTLTKAQIEERFKKLQHLKIHPREEAPNRLIIARGDRLYKETLGDLRDRIAGALATFELAVESQNKEIIDQARVQLNNFLDDIERGIVQL